MQDYIIIIIVIIININITTIATTTIILLDDVADFWFSFVLVFRRLFLFSHSVFRISCVLALVRVRVQVWVWIWVRARQHTDTISLLHFCTIRSAQFCLWTDSFLFLFRLCQSCFVYFTFEVNWNHENGNTSKILSTCHMSYFYSHVLHLLSLYARFALFAHILRLWLSIFHLFSSRNVKKLKEYRTKKKNWNEEIIRFPVFRPHSGSFIFYP